MEQILAIKGFTYSKDIVLTIPFWKKILYKKYDIYWSFNVIENGED